MLMTPKLRFVGVSSMSGTAFVTAPSGKATASACELPAPSDRTIRPASPEFVLTGTGSLMLQKELFGQLVPRPSSPL